MGYVVGRTKVETLSRDLRMLHTALELINECLWHLRFLRDALITDCDIPSSDISLSGAYDDADAADDADVLITDCDIPSSDIPLSGAYDADAISSVGRAAPLRFVIAHLSMLLSLGRRYQE